jgi:hypothetical protein
VLKIRGTLGERRPLVNILIGVQKKKLQGIAPLFASTRYLGQRPNMMATTATGWGKDRNGNHEVQGEGGNVEGCLPFRFLTNFIDLQTTTGRAWD